jgi:DNA-directed RNA polymerase subunit RPC12/RpoP
MHVKQKDYVINKNNKVVRGKSKLTANVSYELTFTMGRIIEEVVCPNCSSKLSTKESNVCPNCGTVVINKKHDLIMVKKRVLSQNK